MTSPKNTTNPRFPKEAIVRPEDEHPTENEVHPEQVLSKDEREYESMTTTENDLDSDDNPDYDPEV